MFKVSLTERFKKTNSEQRFEFARSRTLSGAKQWLRMLVDDELQYLYEIGGKPTVISVETETIIYTKNGGERRCRIEES